MTSEFIPVNISNFSSLSSFFYILIYINYQVSMIGPWVNQFYSVQIKKKRFVYKHQALSLTLLLMPTLTPTNYHSSDTNLNPIPNLITNSKILERVQSPSKSLIVASCFDNQSVVFKVSRDSAYDYYFNYEIARTPVKQNKK